MTTMLLAHSHPAVRAWVCDALAQVQDVEFVAEARDDREVSRLIEQLHWDVALISCSLLDGRLAETAEPPGSTNWDVHVVVLGAPDRDGLLCRLWRAGALGYVPEDAAPEAIVEAVQVAAQGGLLWTEEQIAQAEWWWDEVGSRLEALTERERQVLDLMADGLSNRQIAERLLLTENTVQTHVRHVLSKLAASNRVEAAMVLAKGLEY
ncbi:MAG TPA: response regulator transcription factor [Anaerolineae bacterium]|nr:response regulator transcription factor [Anaerolineae bacterium]